MNLNGQLNELVNELVRRGVTLEQARKVFEKEFIVSTLRENNGNLSQTARTLGVHRNTLRNRVSALEIAGKDYTAGDTPEKPRRHERSEH